MPAELSPDIFKAYDIRGLYGEQIDGDIAERIGRAFARVLARLREKDVAELRIGLGRDMRLSAPELAARYRRGMLAEGAHVVDAGQVGSEMLYFLVGSRELDGGLMCTASHNPKAYTGAKLVRDGAIALSGESGIQDIRREVEADLAWPTADGVGASAGEVTEVDIYGEFQAAALGFIDPAAIGAGGRRLKVVLDGGNGMAGPMVGPLLERLDLELIETYWTPDGNFPDHEPNPLLPENRSFIIEQVRASGADLGIAWDGDADRCFFIDDTGEFVDGDFLTALLAESLLRKNAESRAPGGDPVRRARLARSRRHGQGGRRDRRTSTASATPSSRRACARRARCSAARSPATTTSATSTARTPARCRRCSCWSCSRARAGRCRSCSRPTTSATSSPARSTPRSARRRRRWRRSPRPTPTPARNAWTASRSTTTTGTSTCARRTPSRCCACAWSRWCRAPTWSAAATRCWR